ncbi:MAG: hypothetical protein WC505_07285 [Patescibacteria group bacterium]
MLKTIEIFAVSVVLIYGIMLVTFLYNDLQKQAAIHEIQRESVVGGYGEYYMDADGNMKFRWKEMEDGIGKKK